MATAGGTDQDTTMPIRFRCAYCKQLMGIARRKAGAIVRCPRCAGEVIVPATEDGAAVNGAGPLNDLLESEEFDKALADVHPIPDDLAIPLPAAPYDHVPRTAPDAPPKPGRADPSMSCDVRRSGVFLPTSMLVVAVALLVATLAVMFGLGCIVGRWMGR